MPQQLLTAMQPKAGTGYFCIDTAGAVMSEQVAANAVYFHCVLCPCSTCTDTAAPPTFSDPLMNGTSVTVSWNHTDKGPCFNHLTFSYNITWYPVVDGVPQKGEGQSGVTGPGATEYIITNLMNNGNYQVELFGFTPSHPPVFSIVATVGFKTKGVCLYIVHGGITRVGFLFVGLLDILVWF